MYVEPWILWLILAPLAAPVALYLGYLLLLLVGLLSLTMGMGLSMLSAGLSAFVNWLAAFVNWLAACYARGLSFLVRPFRHVGPWLDYAVVAGIGLAISLGGLKWLAA